MTAIKRILLLFRQLAWALIGPLLAAAFFLTVTAMHAVVRGLTLSDEARKKDRSRQHGI